MFLTTGAFFSLRGHFHLCILFLQHLSEYALSLVSGLMVFASIAISAAMFACIASRGKPRFGAVPPSTAPSGLIAWAAVHIMPREAAMPELTHSQVGREFQSATVAG